MRLIIGLILIGLIQSPVFSQSINNSIKVSKDLNLIKLSDNAFLCVSFYDLPNYGRTSANGLIFINGNKAFLLDSPWTDEMTKDLIQYISNTLRLKVVGFISTHWHIDRMGGLGFLLK